MGDAGRRVTDRGRRSSLVEMLAWAMLDRTRPFSLVQYRTYARAKHPQGQVGDDGMKVIIDTPMAYTMAYRLWRIEDLGESTGPGPWDKVGSRANPDDDYRRSARRRKNARAGSYEGQSTGRLSGQVRGAAAKRQGPARADRPFLPPRACDSQHDAPATGPLVTAEAPR